MTDDDANDVRVELGRWPGKRDRMIERAYAQGLSIREVNRLSGIRRETVAGVYRRLRGVDANRATPAEEPQVEAVMTSGAIPAEEPQVEVGISAPRLSYVDAPVFVPPVETRTQTRDDAQPPTTEAVVSVTVRHIENQINAGVPYALATRDEIREKRAQQNAKRK